MTSKDAARVDLWTSKAELEQKYDDVTVARLIRIRDEYQWVLANPDARDRQFVEEFAGRYGVCDAAVYKDLAIIKQLMPALSAATRDFHRWKTNQMLLETYQMARKRKDTKTMERALTSLLCSLSRQRRTLLCLESSPSPTSMIRFLR